MKQLWNPKKKPVSGSADGADDVDFGDGPSDVQEDVEDVLDYTAGEDANAEAAMAPKTRGKRKVAPAKAATKGKRAASKASGKATASNSKPPTAPKTKVRIPPVAGVMMHAAKRRPSLGSFPHVDGVAETEPGTHHRPVSSGADFSRSLARLGLPQPGATAAVGSEARIPKSGSVFASEDGDGAKVASDEEDEGAAGGEDAREATDSDGSNDDANDFHSCKEGSAGIGEGSAPRTQAKSHRGGSGSASRAAELQADYQVLLGKFNAAMGQVAALRKDKRYLQSSLDDKCAVVEQLRKTIAAKELDIVRLKAEVEAAEAETTPQISNTGAPTSAKKLAAIRAKGKQAQNVAMLPVAQRQILGLCTDNTVLDFAKAVTRQCDPEAYLLEGRRSYKWLPSPQRLSTGDSFECGATSAGGGCLGNGLVVEPPMLCVNRKAMSGGFFGGYDGRKQEWLIHLLRITPKMRDALLDAAGDTAGRLATQTDEDIEEHCLSLCTGTASAGVRRKLKARFDSQASYRKDTAVREYMKKMGYFWILTKDRTDDDIRECEIILRRVLGMRWKLGTKGPGDVMNPTADELLRIVKRGVIQVDNLSRWRKRPISKNCHRDLDEADRMEYSVDGADIFLTTFLRARRSCDGLCYRPRAKGRELPRIKT